MIRKLGLILLLTTFFFLLIEFFFRLFFGNPIISPDFFIPDKILNHKHNPSITNISRPIGRGPYIHTTNSQSFIEHEEISLQKPKDVIRIFYIGDSNIEGPVSEEERLTSFVKIGLKEEQKKLNKKIQIINDGTASWSPSIYYLEIKNHLLSFSPDIIFLNVDMSDCLDDASYKKFTKFDEKGLPIAVSPTNLGDSYRLSPQGIIKLSNSQYIFIQMEHFFYSNTAIYYHIKNFSGIIITKAKRSEFIRRIFGKPKYYLTPPSARCWLNEDWSNEKEDISYIIFNIENIINLLKEKNVKIIITGVPYFHQFSGIYSAKAHYRLAEIAKKHDVLYLNSFEALKPLIANTDVAKYYWIGDSGHFNPDGYKIWAKAQLDFLLDPKNKVFEASSKEL